MTDAFVAACVQMNSRPDMDENLSAVTGFIRQAHLEHGAALICTPENTDIMLADRKAKAERAPVEEEHPFIPAFSELARETGAWLLLGSIAVKVEEARTANRSYLFNSHGDIVASYDKIHMFDVDLPDGKSFRESDNMRPGDQAVVAQTPWGGLGMAICYDLRFPYLFRTLAQGGAKIITMPAAFTVPTAPHWPILLRARAIETGSFVIAPAQTGQHDGDRETPGHSMIINPWGEILAEAGEEPGVISAKIFMSEVDKMRVSIPTLSRQVEVTPPQGA